MPRALKVFRTAIGFRDAYVAAPSKAAALRAWGTQKDLFARGAAELVTDEALVAEPLEKPGEVVYRTRGGLEEQVAALGKLPSRKTRARKADSAPNTPAKIKPSAAPEPPRPPRPSRTKLEAAEAAVQALQEEHAHEDAKLRERERALAAEREKVEQRFAERLDLLRAKEKRAREAYEAKLRQWQP